MMSVLEFVTMFGVVTLTAAAASQGLHCLRRSREQRSDQHTGLVEDLSSGRPAEGAWHEPRYGKRYAINCPIEYVVRGTRYEGRLVDMSRRGWRAQGTHPVVKGTPMIVRILGSDPAQCITIDEAVVRWTDGLEFGVEVTHISPDSAARLSDYLTLHYPPEEPVPVYALSPFSYN